MASKCASLNINYTAQRRVLPTVYEISSVPMVPLSSGQVYCHLGVPTEFKVTEAPEQHIGQMRCDLQKFDDSLLAPLQKVDVVSTFVLTCIDFILRGAMVDKGPLTKLADDVK